jgi:hypothetical protein
VGQWGAAEWEKRRRRGIPRVQLFFRFSPALYDELERKYKYASQRRATSFARSLYHYERAALERDAQEHTDALYFYDKRKQHFKRQPRKRRQSYVLENARHFASTVISTFPLIAACHLSLSTNLQAAALAFANATCFMPVSKYKIITAIW